MREDAHIVSHQRPCGREDRQQRSLDDRGLGLHDGQAVRERGAGEIGVDQRGRDADPREPEPDREIFGSVRHNQRNDVAPDEPNAHRPTGIKIGARVEFTIGEGFALARKRRPIREFERPFFEIVAQRSVGVLRYRLRRLDDPQQADDISDLTLEPCQHSVDSCPADLRP